MNRPPQQQFGQAVIRAMDSFIELTPEDRDTSEQQSLLRHCSAPAARLSSKVSELLPGHDDAKMDEIRESGSEDEDLDEGDDDDDEILRGRYWQLLSAKVKDAFRHMENIGEDACVLLHGHVVQLVERSLQDIPRGSADKAIPVKVISESVALYILRTWIVHKDYWKLLRLDYHNSVRTLAEQVVAMIQACS